MRTRTAVAATLVALPLLLAVPASAHNGDHPTAVGWWTSTPGAQEAPEDGFEVASFAGRPVSVAALRFDVGADATSATLTLVESEGTATPATALQACATSEQWQPADPGPMDEAPEPDCTAGVDLTRDEEAGTWTGEVGSLLAAGSVMIVPGEVPAGGAPFDPGFRLRFAEAGLATTATPAVGSSPAFAEPESGGGGSFAAPSAPAPSFSSPSFSTDVAPPAEVPEAPAAEVPEAEAGDDATEEAFMAPTRAETGGPAGGRPWARLLLLVPLSVAGGLASVQGRKLLAARGIVEA